MCNIYFSYCPQAVMSLYGYNMNNMLQRKATKKEAKCFLILVEKFDESGDPAPSEEEVKAFETQDGVFLTDGYQTVASCSPTSNPWKGLSEIWHPFINNLMWEENIEKLKKMFGFFEAQIPRQRLFNIINEEDEEIEFLNGYKDLIESEETKTYMSPNGDILVESENDFFVVS